MSEIKIYKISHEFEMRRALNKFLLPILPLKFHSLPYFLLHSAAFQWRLTIRWINPPSYCSKSIHFILFSCNLLFHFTSPCSSGQLCRCWSFFLSYAVFFFQCFHFNRTGESVSQPYSSFCLFGFLGDFFCYSYFFNWWGFDSFVM